MLHPIPPSILAHTLQYLLRESRADKKAIEADGDRPTSFHPNLFTYADTSGPASSVPPLYIALGRACVAENPLNRPTFDEVLKILEIVWRDLEPTKRVAEAPVAAAAVFVMPEPEPSDPKSYMNTRGGVIAAKATRQPVVGLQQRSGTGSGLGINSLRAVQGSLQSGASGDGPGSGLLGGAFGGMGGIPLGSDILGSVPRSALGGSG